MVKSCPTLCDPMNCSTAGFPDLYHILEFAQTHVPTLEMPFNHLISHCPFLLPSVFPNIRNFSNESALLIRWPKYWSFSFSIGPSSEYWWLFSFRIDWFDLLALQETLKSLPQHTVWKHQFFCAQPSLWSSSHICTWLLEKPYLWRYGLLLTKWCLCF